MRGMSEADISEEQILSSRTVGSIVGLKLEEISNIAEHYAKRQEALEEMKSEGIEMRKCISIAYIVSPDIIMWEVFSVSLHKVVCQVIPSMSAFGIRMIILKLIPWWVLGALDECDNSLSTEVYRALQSGTLFPSNFSSPFNFRLEVLKPPWNGVKCEGAENRGMQKLKGVIKGNKCIIMKIIKYKWLLM